MGKSTTWPAAVLTECPRDDTSCREEKTGSVGQRRVTKHWETTWSWTDGDRVRTSLSLSLSMLLQTMEENCTLRPCATDFSIAAIMARHDRRARSKQQDSADTLSPLGRQSAVRHCTRHMPHDGHCNVQRNITHLKTCFNFQVRQLRCVT